MCVAGIAMPRAVAVGGAIGIAPAVIIAISTIMSEPLSDRYTSRQTKVA